LHEYRATGGHLMLPSVLRKWILEEVRGSECYEYDFRSDVAN